MPILDGSANSACAMLTHGPRTELLAIETVDGSANEESSTNSGWCCQWMAVPIFYDSAIHCSSNSL